MRGLELQVRPVWREPRLGTLSPWGRGSVFTSRSFPQRRGLYLPFRGNVQCQLRPLPQAQARDEMMQHLPGA